MRSLTERKTEGAGRTTRCLHCGHTWEPHFDSGPTRNEWFSAAEHVLLNGNQLVLREHSEYPMQFICQKATGAGYKVRVMVERDECVTDLVERFGIPAKRVVLPPSRILYNDVPTVLRALQRNASQTPKRTQMQTGFEFWIVHPWDYWEVLSLLTAARESCRIAKIIFIGSDWRDFAIYVTDILWRERKSLSTQLRVDDVPRSAWTLAFESGELENRDRSERWTTESIASLGIDWIPTLEQLTNAYLWRQCEKAGKSFFQRSIVSAYPSCPNCRSDYWFVPLGQILQTISVTRLWGDQLLSLKSLIEIIKRFTGSKTQINRSSVIRWALEFLFSNFDLPVRINSECRNEAALLEHLLNNLRLHSTEGTKACSFDPVQIRRWLKRRPLLRWDSRPRGDNLVLYKHQAKDLETTTRLWKQSCTFRLTKNTVLRAYLDLAITWQKTAFLEWMARKFQVAVSPS